jgi:ABC-type uncharacterized transport system auxiliary subunit
MGARIEARTRRTAVIAGLTAFALAACNIIARLDRQYTLAVDSEAGTVPPPPTRHRRRPRPRATPASTREQT